MVVGRRTTAPSGLCKQPRAGQIHGVQGSCSDTQRRCVVVRPGEGCRVDGGRECRSVCGTERRVCGAPSAGCGGRRQPVYLAARASLLRSQPQKRTERCGDSECHFQGFFRANVRAAFAPTPAWHALLLRGFGPLPPEPAHVLRVHRVPSCRGQMTAAPLQASGNDRSWRPNVPDPSPIRTIHFFRLAACACRNIVMLRECLPTHDTCGRPQHKGAFIVFIETYTKTTTETFFLVSSLRKRFDHA